MWATAIDNLWGTFNAIAMVIDRLLIPFRTTADWNDALAFLRVATEHHQVSDRVPNLSPAPIGHTMGSNPCERRPPHLASPP